MPDQLYMLSRIVGFGLVLFLLLTSLVTTMRLEKARNRPKTLRWIQNWKVVTLAAVAVVAAAWSLWIAFAGTVFLNIESGMYYIPGGLAIIAVFVPVALLCAVITYGLLLKRELNVLFSYSILVLGATFIIASVFFAPAISVTINRILWGMYFLAPAYLVSILTLILTKYYGTSLVIKTKDVKVHPRTFSQTTPPSPNVLPAGLSNYYPTSEYIGKGGFARVWKAVRADGQLVALKVLETVDEKTATLFEKEATNWSLLDHENIVQLYEFDTEPIPYLALELCDDTLERVQLSAARRRTLDPVSIVLDLANGLDYAHNKRVVHGDIKMSNVLIHGDIFKISDWGLSRALTGGSVSVSGVTPPYAAPEMLQGGSGQIDERTDLYQLGAVFYELVAGRPPFTGDVVALYQSILKDEPQRPSKFNAAAVTSDYIILKCLKKRKEDRYQNAGELIKDLEALKTKPGPAVPHTISSSHGATLLGGALGSHNGRENKTATLTTKFCRNCGAELKRDANFCARCGVASSTTRTL